MKVTYQWEPGDVLPGLKVQLTGMYESVRTIVYCSEWRGQALGDNPCYAIVDENYSLTVLRSGNNGLTQEEVADWLNDNNARPADQ